MTLQLAIATAIAIVTPAAAAAGHAAAVASAASAVAASHAAAAAAARQGGTLNSIVPAAVDLAIIVLLLVTRARGRPLDPARLLVGPLLLVAIGIGSSTPALHGATLHGIDYLIIGLDLLDSLLVGTIRGFTVRLYRRDGAPWYRYGPVTIALWLLSVLIRVGLAVLGAAHHASPLAEGGDLLFMLGLALLCQNVVVVQRYALRQRACGWR